VVVLVEPAGPLNVGSVARLCANFAMAQLRLVAPQYCSDNAAMIGAFALTHEHRALELEAGIKLQPFSRFINRQELMP
jgi:tRNA C32,U32 (ribose-2'-O)-methylase TrmJ